MTAARTVAAAVLAFGVELAVLTLLVFATAMLGNATYDAIQDTSYRFRTVAAVVTLVCWLGIGLATMFVASRVAAKWLAASPSSALFVSATLTGVTLYFLLAYATFMNDCYWNVAFPLGGRYGCSGF